MPVPPVPPEAPALGILLLSGTHERAHYAFMVAAAAAAIGRRVVLFASNTGCHALCADWSGLADAGRDATVRARGAAGFDELREAVLELGGRLLVCETGLLMAAVTAPLLPGVERAGLATFLAETTGGQLLTL